jgi:cytochrome c oxidase subunit 3
MTSYGKLMMWFYRIRCLNVLWIFSSLWFSRFKFIETWPLADEVFTFHLCMVFLRRCIMLH